MRLELLIYTTKLQTCKIVSNSSPWVWIFGYCCFFTFTNKCSITFMSGNNTVVRILFCCFYFFGNTSNIDGCIVVLKMIDFAEEMSDSNRSKLKLIIMYLVALIFTLAIHMVPTPWKVVHLQTVTESLLFWRRHMYCRK